MRSLSKLIKNTVLLSFSTLLNKGMLFIMIPFFTRWLSVEEYGSFDVFSTYISLLIPIISLATSNAVFRLSVNTDQEQGKAYITNGLYINFINFIIISLILIIVSFRFKFTYFPSFMLLLLSEVLDNYLQGYLRALKKLGLYGLCRTSTVIFTSMSVTFLVKFLHRGLNGLIIGYALGFFLSSFLIIFITRFWNYFEFNRFSIRRIKELISYSWALIPNDISWWVINVSDRQIINLFIGAKANGIYAVATKIPNLCSSIFGVFNVSWQESATDSINDDDKYNFYRTVHDRIFSILLTICIGILACNFLFFDYIFDKRYCDARLYTSILVASVIFSTISLFYGGIQISLKNPKANGFSTVIGALVNLVIHISLIKFIGLYAASISTLISNMVVMVIRKYQLRDSFEFKLNVQQILLCIIFVYYSFLSTQRVSLLLNALHIVVAVIIFVFCNYQYIGFLRFGNKRR